MGTGACRASPANVRRFESLGGFPRITQLLQWAALAFAPSIPSAAGHAEHDQAPTMAGAAAPSSASAPLPAGAVAAAAVEAAPQPASGVTQHAERAQQAKRTRHYWVDCEQLDRVFAALWDWVVPGGDPVGDAAKKGPGRTSHHR